MLTPKVLDLNQVVSESLNMLNRLIGEDIDLVMVPASELGPVKADPGLALPQMERSPHRHAGMEIINDR